MGIKSFLRRNVEKMLGIYPTSQKIENLKWHLHNATKAIIAINLANAKNIPQSIKDDYLLQSYPIPCGGIKFTNALRNIESYLKLLRFSTSDSIRLRRFGGAYDGGYVMMVPYHLKNLDFKDISSFNENSTKNSACTKTPPPPPITTNNDEGLNSKNLQSLQDSFFSQLPNDKNNNMSNAISQNIFTQNSSNAPVAISLGVSPYSPWDLEMATHGYKVAQYDASIESAPYNHPNITFHKKFVGTKNDENYITLESVIEQNAMDEDAHNILQCDIEDCEWDILESIDLALLSKYFSQVLFEFHYCDPESEALTSRRLKVLQKLRDYYTPIFTHFNHHGNCFYCDGLFFSDVVEVSYLRNDLVPKDALPFSGHANIQGLSAPNSAYYPDLPVVFRDF